MTIKIGIALIAFVIAVVATFALVVVRVKQFMLKNDLPATKEKKLQVHRYDLMQRDIMIVILLGGEIFLILLFLS